MTSNLTLFAKAARAQPMAWLTQTECLARAIVKRSFREAISHLPETAGYADS